MNSKGFFHAAITPLRIRNKLLLFTFQDLADWGVFEIAIGGGEPIAHPDFDTIMREGRKMGLALSFTTFNKQFDKTNPELIPLLNDVDSYGHNNDLILGSTGVSVHGPKDVKALAQMRGRLNNAKCYWGLTAQTVVGATPMRTIERTMDVCLQKDMPLLLRANTDGALYRHDTNL